MNSKWTVFYFKNYERCLNPSFSPRLLSPLMTFLHISLRNTKAPTPTLATDLHLCLSPSCPPLPQGGQAPHFRSGPVPSLVLGDIPLAFLPFLLAGSSPSEYNMPLHHPSIKKRENPLLTHIPVWLCPVPLLPTSAELLGGQLSGFRTCPSVETALLVAAGE